MHLIDYDNYLLISRGVFFSGSKILRYLDFAAEVCKRLTDTDRATNSSC